MLRRLPDYTCSETIVRSVRPESGGAFRPLDTVRLQVGWIGGRERYGLPDSKRFDDREIRDVVGRGLTSNGNFAGNVQHVFLFPGAQFTPRGTVTFQERTAARYDYEVPVEYSRYKIRARPKEAEVGIYGSFWFDSRTFDLLRMEVHADEISPELGMSRFTEIVDYARRSIGDTEFLLPASSELSVVTVAGDEFRNRTTFDQCRQFRAESALRFDDEEGAAAPQPEVETPAARVELLPVAQQIDLVLDSDIDLTKSAVGDAIRAVVGRAVHAETGILVPEGAVLQGRLSRLEQSGQPFDHYVVGLEFRTLDAGDRKFEFYATMQDAGPARGLLREARRMDPVFTKRRTARLDILVREKPRGEGILLWEAKNPLIHRGLKMRWLTVDPSRIPPNAP